MLSFLSSLHIPDFTIVFSGGTALSKAHGIIKRFSEDVDFRVIATEELSVGKPSSSVKKILSGFKNGVVDALRQAGFQVSDPEARNANRYFTVDIQYKTQFDRFTALRPDIKLVVTVLSPQIEISHMPVQSFLAQLKNEPPEVGNIACISPVETAADKLSALVWRIPDRTRYQDDERSLVRHIHDLAALENIAGEDTRFPGLVIKSLQEDNDRVKNTPFFATLSNEQKFELMFDTLAKDIEYPAEL